MATGSVSCSWVGSGTTSYSQYTSTIHLNSSYRACASFSISGIPSGATVNSVSVTMTRSSNIYTQSQSVSFSASTSSSWSYTSKGSASTTLSYSSSGNRCTGSLSASFGQTLLSMGSGYLHLSAGESDDIIYSGISISISYTEPAVTYTVKCLKGSYGSGTDQTLTKTQGKSLTLPGAIFTRTGYTQAGWSTSTYGTSKAYDLGASYSTDAAATLYPYWEVNTYTVICRPGANGSGGVKYYYKTHGETMSLPGALYTRSGYTQTGWATSDGGSKAYDLGGSYTSNSGATLYPYWTKNTYVLTFVAGTDGTGSEQTLTKTHGEAVTLPGEIFTRPGYKQVGWATSDGGSLAYDLGGSYSAESAQTFYPVWEIAGMPIYRWDGTKSVQCLLYRWDGEKPVPMYIHSRHGD